MTMVNLSLSRKPVFLANDIESTDEIVSVERAGSQFQVRHGPMWYPYDICERPRYRANTGGPLHTDSTELINITQVPPGVGEGAPILLADDGTGSANFSAGVGGALPDRACESHHAPDQIIAKILDTHPSLRPCSLDYTYGNAVNKAGEARFAGYGRKRGVIDLFLYTGIGWLDPPFGNFGRPRLTFEMSNERGDYLGGPNGKQLGRRWMPMFPKRENIRSTSDVFSEDREAQAIRLLCVSSPVGSIAEVVPEGTSEGGLTTIGAPRFTHKEIIGNRTGAAIEFPFSPFFPMFLPDSLIGNDQGGRVPIEEGSAVAEITTMWAWREAEQAVQRGLLTGNLLQGIRLQTPDYFIDNRRLEVRLRPSESSYVLQWTPPQYNLDDGELTQNASIKLGDGPPRPIVIDFVNRLFELGDETGTVYEPVGLGESEALPCVPGPSDNPQMAPECVCITDVTDPELQGPPSALPSRFLHLDELAPDGFVALYTTTDIRTPFLIDLTRFNPTDPCCLCISYIPGIFFRLSGDLLPSIPGVNVARTSSLEGIYTWSRVPHGLGGGTGEDEGFAANEENGDNTLIGMLDADVFRNRVNANVDSLNLGNNSGAIFPSPAFARSIIEIDEGVTLGGTTFGASASGGIRVNGAFTAGDPRLHGGRAADDDDFSEGQSESITLSMVFATYVKITKVEVVFFSGTGWEVPKYTVGIVPPANRVQTEGALRTNNVPLIVGKSVSTAVGTNIPGVQNLDADAVREGNSPFRSIVIPSYDDLPFWEQFGMEWQLTFEPRGSAQSMGIFAIEVTADAMTTGSQNTEIIGIRERKYYRSTGSIPGGLNPERFLQELDSATVYWRATERGAFQGANRHRAYSWGDQINDDQERVNSTSVDEIEQLQEEEYDAARSLLESPYIYSFQSFIPLDEGIWFSVVQEGEPTWTFTASMEISELAGVLNASNGLPAYGVIPTRTVWNAPGHAWIHDFDETYVPCCFGCFHSKIVTYKFQHLHDELGNFEPASFWNELPSGMSRLLRSTMMLPDPTFQGGETGVGDTLLIDEGAFSDQNGNPITPTVLNSAGFSRDPVSGQIWIDRTTPQAAVGGPAGPDPNCGTGGAGAAGGGGGGGGGGGAQ